MQKNPSIGTPERRSGQLSGRRIGRLRLLAGLVFLTMFSSMLAGCPPPPHRGAPPAPPKPPGAMMRLHQAGHLA